MAETHVMSALKSRRAEIAQEVRTLTAALMHLDATIRLFEQGKPPKARRQQLSRRIFQALREGPLTAEEVAAKVDEPVKAVTATLSYQRGRGRVRNGMGGMWELIV